MAVATLRGVIVTLCGLPTLIFPTLILPSVFSYLPLPQLAATCSW